jgi:phosphate transport system protein
MPSEHILKAFDEELKRLDNLIARMGGLAETQLARAVEALERRDGELAAKVVEDDRAIDELEHEIDIASVRMLALRQPMAADLRSVIAALKISSDLERIGDYAANVAKRSIALSQAPLIAATGVVPRMARLAQAMIKDVLDSYGLRDVDRAVAVWHRDQEIDDMYTGLFRELLTYMMEDPRNIGPCTHLLFIAKNIERIGDHATNIAETVHFMVTGKRLWEARPKGDTTAYAVVAPKEGKEV